MEQASRWANGLNAWALRVEQELATEGGPPPPAANVAGLRRQDAPMVIDVETTGAVPDWSNALLLVEHAGEALRNSEERIDQLEAEADRMLQESRAEFEALHAQLRLAQREIERAHAQAADATARATAAEAWLDKLGGTIVQSFGRLHNGPRHES